MHPDSQSLEASFDADRSERDSSAASGHDPVVQDFNAFFEKLSALDNLQWSPESETEAPPAPGTAAPRSRPPRKAAGRARATPAGNAPKPRMNVVKSDTDLAGPPPAAAAPVTAAAIRSRITARDVARFLKMTLVGLLLFALGLGAGWAALSMPGRFDEVMPNVSRLMERTRAIAGNQQGSEAPVARQARPAAADRLHVVEGPREGNASQTAATGRTEPNARTSEHAAVPVTPPPTVGAGDMERGIELPRVGQPDDEPVAASDAEPEDGAPAPASAAADRAPAARAAGPQYTLQVGACSSFECVQNYRQMLLRKVGSGEIAVVPQPASAGGTPIQRIRVQPLARDAAERLKSELARMDPRFRDAYVIALR